MPATDEPTNPDPTNGTQTTGGIPDPPRPRRRRRPTVAEQAERLAFVRRLLGCGCRKGKIKRSLRRRYGNLSAKTCERLLSLARPDRPRRAVSIVVAVLRQETGRIVWAVPIAGPEPLKRLRRGETAPATLADWCAYFGGTPQRLADLIRGLGDGRPGETVAGPNPPAAGGP
jgi:hypothetical protein